MHRSYAKVSRLPAKTRNQVNEMLYDGAAYTKIIAWLEEQGHPGFNEMNISRWREGGYQAWLNAQERHDHREFLRELAEQTKSDDATFQDASIHLAQLQFFEALNRLEGADLAIMVKENRKEFIQLLKTFTHFNRYCLQRQKFRHDLNQQEQAERHRNQPPKESVTDENMERICAKFNLK
jgi:hypothetical protein